MSKILTICFVLITALAFAQTKPPTYPSKFIVAQDGTGDFKTIQEAVNAKTVFIRTEMDKHITPAGWDTWGNADNEKTVIYAEFESYGEGAAAGKRAQWSKQLSKKDLKQYTAVRIFTTDQSEEVDWVNLR